RQNGGGKNGFGPPEEYRPDNNQYNDRHNDRRERRERPAGAARRPDFFLTRWADKAVEKYYQIVPRRSLAKSAPVKERLMVLLAVLAVIGVITGTISLIMAATPQNISGKWQLTDNDKMTFEFNRGKVVVMILSEGRWVEDRRGEYTTKKQDDKNLLVIIYEDGITRHLYYEIDGDTAVFTNVDTNIQQTGIRS
ncbi:MAG: hypothetical protein FWE86_03560, partial [Oscillospiraceae bacterium]|nr:hypothetical protein [Oscillospiraceae bacterium]